MLKDYITIYMGLFVHLAIVVLLISFPLTSSTLFNLIQLASVMVSLVVGFVRLYLMVGNNLHAYMYGGLFMIISTVVAVFICDTVYKQSALALAIGCLILALAVFYEFRFYTKYEVKERKVD